jgi:Fic-DOC domain mobile mystery protein B
MSLFFQNRDGQTPIDASLVHELKLNHIQDMTELYEQERENIALAILWLDSSKASIYDNIFWLEIHKRMYSNVWKFAGKVRTTELNNTDFNMPYDIRPSLKNLSDDLKTWVEFKTYNDKELASIFHERLLTIHPFRDGNGRWARVLTEVICKNLKITIPNWGGNIASDEERRSLYITAVKEARHQGAYEKLINIMFYKME